MRRKSVYGFNPKKWLMASRSMENFSTVMIVVALAILDASGRVLMQQRPAHKHHGGLWEFPGGKLEAGETCESAVVREIDEELGISVEPADLFPISFASEALGPGGRPIVLLLFGLRNWSGVPIAREQGTAIRWVEPGGLVGLLMPPLDVALAKAVIPLLEGVAKAETPS
ncbi:MAG: (deoxy)nucleoside triphosphate pyrophosphohydrolase [Novosphingobium sp.]